MEITQWLPVIFCGLSVPLSIFMWLGNLAFSRFWRTDFEEDRVIPPTRWLFSTLLPIAFMAVGLRRGSVNKSGAILGVIFAFILSIANHAFFVCLATFFFTSSRATKFRAHLKRKFDGDFKGGEGQRNWVQVLCNGAMATQLAVLYLIDCGSSERSIDFARDYRASWLSVAVMSSFACCNGDTWASELGSVLSKRDPWLITTLRRVPKGTNGGVSWEGLLVSFLGGLAVGLSYYFTVLYTVDIKQFANSPPQWPIIIYGGLAGLFGSLADSFLGAIFQYSGIDEEGRIVDYINDSVRHISGLRMLDNSSINLISSVLTGVIIPWIAVKSWPEF